MYQHLGANALDAELDPNRDRSWCHPCVICTNRATDNRAIPVAIDSANRRAHHLASHRIPAFTLDFQPGDIRPDDRTANRGSHTHVDCTTDNHIIPVAIGSANRRAHRPASHRDRIPVIAPDFQPRDVRANSDPNFDPNCGSNRNPNCDPNRVPNCIPNCDPNCGPDTLTYHNPANRDHIAGNSAAVRPR